MEGSSSVGEQLGVAASAIFSAYDVYGWIVPAVFLTILLFATFVFICSALEDLVLEFPLIRGPRFIFSGTRKLWRGEPFVKEEP